MDYNILKELIKDKASDFGFSQARIAQLIIPQQSQDRLHQWLSNNYHGTMDYLARNTHLRCDPSLIVPGSLAVITVSAPYLNVKPQIQHQRLADPDQAYIASYALGRDYHKVIKQQLEKYAKWIQDHALSPELHHNYRVFTDSAPIMEVELAANAGAGWRGKNTLLINRHQGSFYFLGEIFTTLPLPADEASSSHCGSCQRCLDKCPTKAFTAPYVLDARKCIAYLTIENKGPIPTELRPLIGNRVYGCDDCQLVCPWNKFSQLTTLTDFAPRHKLDSSTILELFNWTEAEFKHRLAGSPIYRIGYQAWQRNLAVGLGNANYNQAIVNALQQRLTLSTPLVQEHIRWAIERQLQKRN